MKIVIIGGVAGGATAATRLRRLSETNEIIIFERGEYVSFANCGLPYHIGGIIRDRNKLLLQTPASLKKRFNLDVRVLNEVIAINNAEKTVQVRNLKTQEIYTVHYDKLLLAPGAEPFRPTIPGINTDKILSLRNIHDMDRIISQIAGKRKIAVVGGGFIGLEVAENLIEKGLEVDLIELGNQIMAPVDFEFAQILHKKAVEKGIQLHLNSGVEKFEPLTDGTLEIALSNGKNLTTELVIFAIGVKPENQLAKNAGLEIGTTGGILVNEYMQTSDSSIYAVGDAVEVTHFVNHNKVLIPLAWPANRQGRLVADNITYGNQVSYTGSLGSSVLKFFDLTMATTGLNEKTLKKSETPYETITVTRANHAGYYPGGSHIILKLLFNQEKTILGAQAIGHEGVEKRIDVLATAIKAGLKVDQLAAIELTYAPPYNAAKDPVNIAGYAAENILNKEMLSINYDQVATYLAENTTAVLLDVRTSLEHEMGHIPNSINLDLDHLRENLQQLDKNKTYIVYCQVGLRGYLAHAILRHNGYKSLNLNGGYSIWALAQENY